MWVAGCGLVTWVAEERVCPRVHLASQGSEADAVVDALQFVAGLDQHR